MHESFAGGKQVIGEAVKETVCLICEIAFIINFAECVKYVIPIHIHHIRKCVAVIKIIVIMYMKATESAAHLTNHRTCIVAYKSAMSEVETGCEVIGIQSINISVEIIGDRTHIWNNSV